MSQQNPNHGTAMTLVLQVAQGIDLKDFTSAAQGVYFNAIKGINQLETFQQVEECLGGTSRQTISKKVSEADKLSHTFIAGFKAAEIAQALAGSKEHLNPVGEDGAPLQPDAGGAGAPIQNVPAEQQAAAQQPAGYAHAQPTDLPPNAYLPPQGQPLPSADPVPEGVSAETAATVQAAAAEAQAQPAQQAQQAPQPDAYLASFLPSVFDPQRGCIVYQLQHPEQGTLICNRAEAYQMYGLPVPPEPAPEPAPAPAAMTPPPPPQAQQPQMQMPAAPAPQTQQQMPAAINQPMTGQPQGGGFQNAPTGGGMPGGFGNMPPGVPAPGTNVGPQGAMQMPQSQPSTGPTGNPTFNPNQGFPMGNLT